jgi:hypothetical protein
MNNVIPIGQARQNKEDLEYKKFLKSLDKLELLEEMVKFQEERSRVGVLTDSMIKRGIPLFQLLEDCAETHELRTLSRSYRRHLQEEQANELA